MWQHWPAGDDFLQPPPWAEAVDAANATTVIDRMMECNADLMVALPKLIQINNLR